MCWAEILLVSILALFAFSSSAIFVTGYRAARGQALSFPWRAAWVFALISIGLFLPLLTLNLIADAIEAGARARTVALLVWLVPLTLVWAREYWLYSRDRRG